MKALVAIDETEASWDAAVFAGELFGEDDEVTLVNVYVPVAQAIAGAGGLVGFPTVGLNPYLSDVGKNVEQIKSRLRPAAQAAGADDIVVEEGSVVDGLCQAAEELDADLLVVGNRDRGWLMGLLSPSVSSRLVSSAPCPVLVVRPRDPR